MKYAQRLDDARLAEVLNERGMADLDAIRDLLKGAQSGGMPFAEALVTTSLVSDWDLSRVVAEIFQLPFLPVGIVKPDANLYEELASRTLAKYGLVPLSRFGQVLTVAMPALVPAEILGMLSAESDLVILPVVGTVETNRRWLLEQRSGSAKQRPGHESDWGALFDEGDAAVQLSLDDEELEGELPESSGDLEEVGEPVAALPSDSSADGEELDVDAELEALGGLEFTDGGEDEEMVEPPSLAELDTGLDESIDEEFEESSTLGGSGDLPPAPDFG